MTKRGNFGWLLVAVAFSYLANWASFLTLVVFRYGNRAYARYLASEHD
jgi:hypothetical protein